MQQRPPLTRGLDARSADWGREYYPSVKNQIDFWQLPWQGEPFFLRKFILSALFAPLRTRCVGRVFYVIGKFKYSPKGKSPHSLSISFSFPFQNFKPIFSHYNYSSMELNGTGFSQAFPFNFHSIPQTIPRIFPYSSHSFPLIFPGSSLTIFSFSFLALFSFLSRQLGTLTSLYEI